MVIQHKILNVGCYLEDYFPVKLAASCLEYDVNGDSIDFDFILDQYVTYFLSRSEMEVVKKGTERFWISGSWRCFMIFMMIKNANLFARRKTSKTYCLRLQTKRLDSFWPRTQHSWRRSVKESNRTPGTEPSSSVFRSRTHSPILQEQGECGNAHLSHNIVCLLLGTCISFFGLEILMFACLQ